MCSKGQKYIVDLSWKQQQKKNIDEIFVIPIQMYVCTKSETPLLADQTQQNLNSNASQTVYHQQHCSTPCIL